MTWSAALRLGRVSNLPTVWSNVLAAAVLAGVPLASLGVPLTALGCSLVYVGGMFLNDAFDREFDARFRAERPIPAGVVSASTVFRTGFALLGVGALAIVTAARLTLGADVGAATAAVAGLTGLVVLYDAWHKDNPLGPLLMGLCRVLVYVTTAAALTGQVSDRVVAGAAMLLVYLMGLTYVARHEHLGSLRSVWPLVLLAIPFLLGVRLVLEGGLAAGLYLGFLGWVLWAVSHLGWRNRRDVPRAVGGLIAGIALLDMLLMLGQGATGPALLALAAFAMTVAAQRAVPGT